MDITIRRSEGLFEKFKLRTSGQLRDDRLHWIDVRGEPDQAVINYARLFDLTIVGQYENLTGADEMELHPDHIAYASGRPIIVVPKYFQPASIVEHSVVAWGQIEPYSLP